MLSVWLSVISLLIVIATHWLYRWRNPKCNGKLPPGSMGFPLIGETLSFLVTSKSIDMPPFIKKRMKQYGPIFRTSLAGRPVVVSSDPEFNYYVFQQEGKLVERWYMDSFAKILHQDATRINAHKNIHKYLRNLILGSFGPEVLKDKMLPKLEDAINQRLLGWSKLSSLEVKKSTSSLIFDFTAKQLFSYDAEKSSENIGESFTNFLQGLMSFPINIPGTAYYNCLQVISESLRLSSVAPGILRRTLEDIQVNGYTIPKGWALMVVPAALQLNPSTYEDPLAFNPWRWQDISANVTAKNFIPFGAGMTSCAGADFSKVLMGVFVHVMVTKYRSVWSCVDGVNRGGGLGLGLAVEGNTALGSRWRSCGVGLVVVRSCLVLRSRPWGCGVADLEVFVTVGASWWRLRIMVTVSALGLGVLMGASVGLGFGYLGGVVVSAWGCGSRPGVVWCGVGLGLGWWTEGRRCGVVTGRKRKKKREMRREKKKLK
uniref:Cytochrome P450 n=1 Tax=Fagus sylvatica TaxID=28930 RepID=A0A2N9JB45_FAGSY